MTSLLTGAITTGCIFGGAVAGMLSRKLLPQHHLSADSQNTIKLAAAMLATLSAMVLGLLVSSAKGTYDSTNDVIMQDAVKIISLNHALQQYGPEAEGARVRAREGLAKTIAAIWPEDRAQGAGIQAVEQAHVADTLEEELNKLTPQADVQRQSLAEARRLASELVQSRLLMVEKLRNKLPVALVVVMVGWLTLLFFSFGMYAPTNPTVIMALLACVLSVSAAVFLVQEMSNPLNGVIKVSSQPFRDALRQMGE